jgi:hypothetical protein
LCRGGGMNGFPSFPSLSLFPPTSINKMTSSLHSPFIIIYCSLHPTNILRYFSNSTKKKLSLN